MRLREGVEIWTVSHYEDSDRQMRDMRDERDTQIEYNENSEGSTK